MVFDEGSPWWSVQKEELLNLKELEEKIQQKIHDNVFQIQLSSNEPEDLFNDGNVNQR